MLKKVLKNMKNYDQSIFCFYKAIDINPNEAIDYFDNRLALAKLNNHDQANSSFDKPIKINPNETESYF